MTYKRVYLSDVPAWGLCQVQVGIKLYRLRIRSRPATAKIIPVDVLAERLFSSPDGLDDSLLTAAIGSGWRWFEESRLDSFNGLTPVMQLCEKVVYLP